MANVFNAKVNESWYMLARFNVEKLNNENQYCMLMHQGSHLMSDFFHRLTWTMSGQLQKAPL
jgi:hypothetical protein